MYLAIKLYTLVPKNGVYRNFVDWVENQRTTTDVIFKELLLYARIFRVLNKDPIDSLEKELQQPVVDFRKNESDLPIFIVMEFFRLYHTRVITAHTLAQLIQSINVYLIRRSICDMNSQNISKLFPAVLRHVLEQCDGNYKNIIGILNQEMVGNTVGTSGSYMPTDTQMYDMLLHANVYNRPALRIILDRLELSDNHAPVDLSKLSIEHLMPQTPSKEWLEELGVDEETYLSNLHRLGNLTLAAKPDNSKMSNEVWSFKNEVLKNTNHIKMNTELLSIPKWTIECIEQRTKVLINRICTVFPYPNIKVSLAESSEMIDEATALHKTVSYMFTSAVMVQKNTVYTTADGKNGYILHSSRVSQECDKEEYRFYYQPSRFKQIGHCKEQYCVLVCIYKTTTILNLPINFLDKYKTRFNSLRNQEGKITHCIPICKNIDGTVSMVLSKPFHEEIDISQFIVADLQ